jgi:hypothetical protein
MIARRTVRRAINRNIETKESVLTSTDGDQIAHNNFITLDAALLQTTQGLTDPSSANTFNRIGDEINLQSVNLKMMVELNERYSDVTFRLMVIKSAKGDTPTGASLWKGQSGNKMLDTIDTERYTVIKQKWFKITSANSGTIGSNIGGISTGINSQNAGEVTLSRATKIVRLSIPGKKFSKSGKITYENGTAQVKFFDYRVMLFAYSNWSTSDGLGYNVGRINDYVKIMKYKDA